MNLEGKMENTELEVVKEIHFKEHKGMVISAVSFFSKSYEGEKLIVSGDGTSGKCHIWSSKTGKMIKQFDDKQGAANCLILWNEDAFLVAYNRGKIVSYSTTHPFSALKTINVGSNQNIIRILKFTDEEVLYISSGGKIALHNYVNNVKVKELVKYPLNTFSRINLSIKFPGHFYVSANILAKKKQPVAMFIELRSDYCPLAFSKSEGSDQNYRDFGTLYALEVFVNSKNKEIVVSGGANQGTALILFFDASKSISQLEDGKQEERKKKKKTKIVLPFRTVEFLAQQSISSLFSFCGRYVVVGGLKGAVVLYKLEFLDDETIEERKFYTEEKEHRQSVEEFRIVEKTSQESIRLLTCSEDHTLKILHFKGLDLSEDLRSKQEMEDLEERTNFLVNRKDDYAFGEHRETLFFQIKIPPSNFLVDGLRILFE